MIGVKNNGEKQLEARYDGKNYVFAPGETAALSEDAARHIFGFGLEDKTRVLARLGWLTHSAQLSDAMARLDDFSFLAVESVKFEEPSTLPMKAGGVPLADPAPAHANIDIPEFGKYGKK